MSDDTFEVNGWTVYAHPLFLDQFETMIEAVEKARKKDPKGYKKKRAAKLLAAVLKVAFDDIPSDPTRDVYRQGGTLGDDYKHWFRAKFLQQFRLFFRYQQSADAKVIVLAWVNDDSTLRAYESANDAYAVFRKMSGPRKPAGHVERPRSGGLERGIQAASVALDARKMTPAGVVRSRPPADAARAAGAGLQRETRSARKGPCNAHHPAFGYAQRQRLRRP
ncbi:hypothetical protein ACVWYH_010419 [Bradyrhizobium sp. GM24.11]